jgi:hypothetical protein
MGSGCAAACSGLAASAPTHVHRIRRTNDVSSEDIDGMLVPRSVGRVDMERSVLVEMAHVSADPGCRL